MIGISTISSGRITEYTKKPQADIYMSTVLACSELQMICRRCLLTHLFCRTTYRNYNSMLHTIKAKVTSFGFCRYYLLSTSSTTTTGTIRFPNPGAGGTHHHRTTTLETYASYHATLQPSVASSPRGSMLH